MRSVGGAGAWCERWRHDRRLLVFLRRRELRRRGRRVVLGCESRGRVERRGPPRRRYVGRVHMEPRLRRARGKCAYAGQLRRYDGRDLRDGRFRRDPTAAHGPRNRRDAVRGNRARTGLLHPPHRGRRVRGSHPRRNELGNGLSVLRHRNDVPMARRHRSGSQHDERSLPRWIGRLRECHRHGHVPRARRDRVLYGRASSGRESSLFGRGVGLHRVGVVGLGNDARRQIRAQSLRHRNVRGQPDASCGGNCERRRGLGRRLGGDLAPAIFLDATGLPVGWSLLSQMQPANVAVGAGAYFFDNGPEPAVSRARVFLPFEPPDPTIMSLQGFVLREVQAVRASRLDRVRRWQLTAQRAANPFAR